MGVAAGNDLGSGENAAVNILRPLMEEERARVREALYGVGDDSEILALIAGGTLFVDGCTDKYNYNKVKKWSTNVPGKDIFALDKVFFRHNVDGSHWTCAVIFMEEK